MKTDKKNIIASFFIVIFKLMTFTMKSKYERWFEIICGIFMWLDFFIIAYGILH